MKRTAVIPQLLFVYRGQKSERRPCELPFHQEDSPIVRSSCSAHQRLTASTVQVCGAEVLIGARPTFIGRQKKQEDSEAALWEGRWYQDPHRIHQFVHQGFSREQSIQMVYDECRKEQDVYGLVTHRISYFCTYCAYEIVSHHAGCDPALLALQTAVPNGAFLLLFGRSPEDR